MKYIGITLDGMEKIAIQEIKEKTSSNPKELSKTVILFETDKTLEEIASMRPAWKVANLKPFVFVH